MRWPLSTRTLWNAPDFPEWNELLRKIKNCEDFGMFQDCATPITSERKDEFPLIDENRRSNGIKCNQRWNEDPYVLKENSRWFSEWRSSTNRKSSEHRSAAN